MGAVAPAPPAPASDTLPHPAGPPSFGVGPTGTGRRRFLPSSWALTGLLVLYPLWWAVGLGAFSWILFAFPMAAWMVTQRHLVFPRGFVVWVLFLVWVLASVIQVEGGSRMAGYTLRTGYYLAAGVFWLYLVNTRSRISTRTVMACIVGLWMAVVAGGLLGIVAPNVAYVSPVASLLPSQIGENTFVNDLVNPAFAEVQEVLGLRIPRPKAPFTYTNGWGSAMALLLPLVLGALTLPRLRPSARLVRVFLLLATLPILMSLNRGLWVLLALAACYALLRQRRSGRSRATLLFLAGGLIVATLVAATPLGDPIRDALDTRTTDSDERRSALYEEAIDRTRESPLFGYGTPLPSEETEQSVGTHGQFWTVLFSHGFIGAALYLGFFAQLVWRTRNPVTQLAMWAHVTVVVGTLQMFFYGQLPHQIFLVMAAAGIAYREQADVSSSEPVEVSAEVGFEGLDVVLQR